MTEQDFLLWEAASKDTIDFKMIYVDIAGDVVAGLYLSQCIFWHLPNKKGETKLRIEREGKMWIARADGEWFDEIRLTAKQARRSREMLAEKKIMESKVFKFNGAPKCHVRVVMPKLMAEINRILLDRADLPSGANGLDPEDKTTRPVGHSSLTEITTETTTENNTAPIGDGFALNPEPESKPKKRKNTYPAKEMADIFEKGYPALHAQNKFPWGKESGKWGKAFQRIWEQSGENMEKVKGMATDLYRRIKNAKPTDLFWKEAGFTPTTLSSRWHQLQPVKAVEDIAHPWPAYQSMSLEELETIFHNWTARWTIADLKKHVSAESYSRFLDKDDGNTFAPNLPRILDRENRERVHQKSA